MNMIFDVDNKWARRAYIILFIIAAIPFLLVIFLAECLWKTAKAMVSVVQTQATEAIPTIRDYVNAIRENW